MDDELRRILEEFFGKKFVERFYGPSEDFEKEIEEEIKKFLDLSEIPEELIKKEETPYGKKTTIEPMVYGIRITKIGDEEPRIEEWGNIKPLKSNKVEPYTEIQESGDEYSITAELPGVEEEDIETTIEDRNLLIEAKGKNKEYFKKVPFKSPVEKIEKSYKNGVLDIKLKKRK